MYSLETPLSVMNINFHDKIRKFPLKIFLNICFLELIEEFSRESKMNSNQPW